MPQPIQFDAAKLDLRPRVFTSTTVAASPAAATETVICTLTVNGDLAALAGVVVVGWASITVGTNGVLLTFKLRQTGTSGTTLASSDTETAVATQKYGRSVVGFDASPVIPGQVYVLTATVGSASAGSTVAAATLVALVV